MLHRPFVFPKDLHPDYQLLRLSGHRADAQGAMYARLYDFVPRPLSNDSPAAFACATWTGHEDPTPREVCAPRGPSPRVVERRVGEVTFVINLVGADPTPEHRQYWLETPLTTDLNEVSWLR